MRRFTRSLIVASAFAFGLPALVAATPPSPLTMVPPPAPVLIWLSPLKADPTPVVELFDGGGGLPNLGSSTGYNAGDWEALLRGSHDSGVYDKQIAEIDYLADAYLAHQAGRRVAIVLDVDETSLSNYAAIEADNFTFGPSRQAAVANEIGVAI
jgi:hypothetical protein